MTADEKTKAVLGSVEAAMRVRNMKALAEIAPPRAATEHMPFAGHRTMATVWAQQEVARKREKERKPFRRAMEYGFDPDSLKRERGR